MQSDATAMPWESLFMRTGKTLKGWDSTDVLGERKHADFISFGGGMPAPELFPAEELRRAFSHVLREDAASALQYGSTEGHPPLRSLIVELMRRRGVSCTIDEVLVTTGSQQALDLLGKVLLAPGMRIVIESPTYTGALQAFGLQQVSYLPFPMDDLGLDVAALGDWLEQTAASGPDGHGAAALYTVATYQNPSGVTLSAERRRELLRLSRAFHLPVIEDDPYTDLRYEEAPAPPIRALDGASDVIYLGTFSKTLAPALRVGWVVAPQPVIRRMVVAKQGTDLHTDSLVQRAIVRVCQDFDLDAHVRRLRDTYRARRDAMLEALSAEMPEGVRWTRPRGGMFIWLTLPDGIDSRELLVDASGRGVGYVPGTAFHVDGGGLRAIRLSFSNNGPERIRTGVRRLAGAVIDRCGAKGPRDDVRLVTR